MPSTPQVASQAGIYTVQWEEERVVIRIDRLQEHRSELTGEITVRTSLPGVLPHLHQARFNLTSTTARRTLAKALTERVPLAWDDLLEQACVLVLTLYRAGEPVMEVGNQERETAPPWLLHPLLRRGQPTLLYGPGKTGKSYIAALCGLLVHRHATMVVPYVGVTQRYCEAEATDHHVSSYLLPNAFVCCSNIGPLSRRERDRQHHPHEGPGGLLGT